MNERDLFLAALEIEDPAARRVHLQSACAGDAELLARVESLLASHEGASQFLQTPVGEQLDKEVEATLVIGTGSTSDEARNPAQEKAKMGEEIPLGYLEPSQRPDSLGRLGHYEVLEVVGSGAFGTVLRAFDEKLQRVVAIKVMAPELAATSPARKRFLREAQASAAIRHENVVSVYAVEERPIPYLVMEYIPGVTLQQRLDEKGPLEVPTVLRLGVQIAEGLAAAHAKDLIHRDIKPGNILLETGMRDRVKITDFGLARAADDASMTQSGTIAGTPMYMAPEQALGQKLDQRADLFSFGSVLYQMVSGRPPFRAPSTLAVLKRLTEETPRPIQEIIPETPQWLCNIITKLHAKNPDERYQSAREVADVLADCEMQLKTNSKLQNYSRIPQKSKQPAAGKSGRWRWVAAVAMLIPVLILAVLAIPFLYRYATNEGTLIYSGAIDPNLENILIKRDGQVVAKLLTSHGIVHLPAGDYEAEVVCKEGYELAKYRRGPFSAWGDAPGALGWEEAVGRTIPLTLTRDWDVGISLKLAKLPIDPSNTPKEEPGWVQLFNGKDLSGWQTIPGRKTDWTVKDGVLTGRGPVQNYLYSTKGDYRDFHFRAEARINDVGNSGMHFRVTLQDAKVAGAPPGYEVQIAGPAGDINATGSLMIFPAKDYMLAHVAKPPMAANTWFTQEIIARGRRIIVKVNGQVLVDREHTGPEVGHLALQAFEGNTTVDFRKIEIKELPPSLPDANPPLAIAPFDAAQARSHQEAWAKHLGVPVEYTNSIGMKFRLIPPGEFQMGSTPEEIEAAVLEVAEINADWKEHIRGEAPRHRVVLKQPFYLGIHEVTQAQYQQLMSANPSHFGPQGPGKDLVAGVDTARFPVEMVSWQDAANFCVRLSEQEAIPPCYSWDGESIKLREGTGYRLPSEAEWEFTCRAGTISEYWNGNDVEKLKQIGWFDANSTGRSHTVGELPANPFGLHDMHGNIWEWVQDGWDPTFYASLSEQKSSNPLSPIDTSASRGARGGNWYVPAVHCRSADRGAFDAKAVYGTVGFRAVLSVDAVKAAKQEPLPSTYKNTIGMEFVKVPRGKSWLGGGKDKLGDQEVEIPADFYLGKYEVTQEEWEKVMGENPSHFSRTGDGKDAVKEINDADLKRFPVENVSWDQCQLFVAKLNDREKETGWVYRLPKGAEWEYACRGGPMSDRLDSAFDFYLAKPTNTLLPEQANFKDIGLNRPNKVGSYVPNILGLFDLHGNVHEWCDDHLEEGDTNRNFRGGGWDYHCGEWPAANYSGNPRSHRVHTLGLRLARVRSGTASSAENVPTTPIAAGWVQLFNGKDLTGWKGLAGDEKATKWRIENGLLVSGGRESDSLISDPTSKDFKLRCEMKIKKGSNASILFRRSLSPKGLPSYELQFDNKRGDGPYVRLVRNPLVLPEGVWPYWPVKEPLPIDRWFTCEIWAIGGRITIKYDGKVVFDHPDPDPIVEPGRIVLHSETPESRIEFRKIEIKELPPSSSGPASAIAPFDAAQAKTHQEAWARHLGVKVEFTNSIGMKFVFLPPGEFTMGSTAGEIEAALQTVGEDKEWQERIKSEGPQHKVILTRPIYLGVHEVTQADYERVMGTNPSHFAPQGAGKEAVAGIDTTKHPVEMVSWNDAAEFAARLSSLEKLKPVYVRANDTVSSQEGDGYRLPSEAEWEFACRAGTSTRYWTGDKDEDLAQGGRFDANSGGRTQSVGILKSNPFGIYDTHGSVWEWVQDGWEANFYTQFAEQPATDPQRPFAADAQHVLRGGNWSNTASYCRSSIRYTASPTHRDHTFGFRVALTVDAVKQLEKQRLSAAGPTSSTRPDPFPDAEVQRIAALPAAEQIEEFRKEMKKRNQDFDGTFTTTNENDAVTKLEIPSNNLVDISPVRVFTHLSALDGHGTGAAPGRITDLKSLQGMKLLQLTLSVNKFSDLTPLQGMPLTDLYIDNSLVSDLSPLQGMQLKVLNCSYTQVSSLKSLEGMPIKILWCNNTEISDLTPVKDMPLEWITIQGTKVKDLSPLKGKPLTQIYLDFDPDRDGKILRSLTTLQKINDKPAEDFLKEMK